MYQRLLLRTRHYFITLPRRFGRLMRHCTRFSQILHWTWWASLGILILEMCGISESYETFCEIIKPQTRPLTAHERAIAQSVFGNSLEYDRILIDETAQIGCRKGGFAYVSFYVINCWGQMSDAHLIHELTHIWQYERVGARYILWALQAQHSPQGYNYGGLTALVAQQKRGLRAFNLEQQADIVMDYFLLRNGQQTQWSLAKTIDLPLYETYIAELI
jgi:hypothetical protein